MDHFIHPYDFGPIELPVYVREALARAAGEDPDGDTEAAAAMISTILTEWADNLARGPGDAHAERDALRAQVADLEARWAMPARVEGFPRLAEIIARAERREAAEARVADLEDAQRWIPVGERLPRPGCLVLALTARTAGSRVEVGELATGGWSPGWYLSAYASDCDECEGRRHIDHLDVTHWRPLPDGLEVHP